MKNPLSLIVPALLLAASAAAHECTASSLTEWEKSPDGLAKLKPVAVSKCEDVAKLSESDQTLFWQVRRAVNGLPKLENGQEVITAAELPAVLKTTVKDPRAAQFLNPGERFRIRGILAGEAVCNALVGSC